MMRLIYCFYKIEFFSIDEYFAIYDSVQDVESVHDL